MARPSKDAGGAARAVVPTKSDFVPISTLKGKPAAADLIGSRSLAPQDDGYQAGWAELYSFAVALSFAPTQGAVLRSALLL